MRTPDRDYGWIALGGSFEHGEDLGQTHRFMRAAAAAGQHLDQTVDTARWRPGGGIEALYLVLRNVPGGTEVDVHRERVSDGVLLCTVEHDWLAEPFLDRETGAWQLLAVVLLALVTLSREAGVPLPDLPMVVPPAA